MRMRLRDRRAAAGTAAASSVGSPTVTPLAAGPAGTVTGSPLTVPVESATAAGASLGDAGVLRPRLGPVFWVSAGWVGVVIVLAIVANLLPIDSPTAIGAGAPGAGPSASHLLGTDEIGRDMLSRLIFGARVSMIVGFASVGIGVVVGGALGLLAGYLKGPVDAVVSGLTNVLLAFPALVLALAIVAFTGPTLFHVTLAIGILTVAPLTRVVRGSTIMYAEREFVLAARMVGAGRWRIMLREVLPNVLPTLVSVALVAVPAAIVGEGALSFLGLSVRPPTPSWGNMIAEGRDVLTQYPLVALLPCAAMFVTVLALNIAGDRLRSHLDVKEGGI